MIMKVSQTIRQHSHSETRTLFGSTPFPSPVVDASFSWTRRDAFCVGAHLALTFHKCFLIIHRHSITIVCNHLLHMWSQQYLDLAFGHSYLEYSTLVTTSNGRLSIGRTLQFTSTHPSKRRSRLSLVQQPSLGQPPHPSSIFTRNSYTDLSFLLAKL